MASVQFVRRINPMTFKSFLRRQGKSIEELASETGISVKSMRRIISTQVVTLNVALTIAQKFPACSFDTIFGEDWSADWDETKKFLFRVIR